MISKHVFTFVNIGGAMFARTVHISQMAARMKLKNNGSIWALRIIFGVIGAVGVYEFISLKFTDYMFGKVQFVFIDTNASALMTALQYMSVMVFFAYVGFILQMLLKRNNKTAVQ